MRWSIIFLLTSSLFCMDDHKTEAVIDIHKSDEIRAQSGCECKLCKGIKIAVASNVVSIIVTAAATMIINYSQCYK